MPQLPCTDSGKKYFSLQVVYFVEPLSFQRNLYLDKIEFSMGKALSSAYLFLLPRVKYIFFLLKDFNLLNSYTFLQLCFVYMVKKNAHTLFLSKLNSFIPSTLDYNLFSLRNKKQVECYYALKSPSVNKLVLSSCVQPCWVLKLKA